MRARSRAVFRMLTLFMLMALVIRGESLQARPDRPSGTEGEMPVRYLVYVATADHAGEVHTIRGLSPLSQGMDERVRIMGIMRLPRTRGPAGDDLAGRGTAWVAGYDLGVDVVEWLRRRTQAEPDLACGTPHPRVNDVVLLVDEAGRVLGEASPSPSVARRAREMPETAPNLSPRISTDINYNTWGKVKDLFR